MAYIIDGTPVAIENMLREQRVRIERGELTLVDIGAYAPGTGSGEEDGSDSESIRDRYDALMRHSVSMERACERLAEMHDSLASLTSDVVETAIQMGVRIPEELTRQLAESGIVVSDDDVEYVPKCLQFDFGDLDDKYSSFAESQRVEIARDEKKEPAQDEKEAEVTDAKSAAVPAASSKKKTERCL